MQSLSQCSFSVVVGLKSIVGFALGVIIKLVYLITLSIYCTDVIKKFLQLSLSASDLRDRDVLSKVSFSLLISPNFNALLRLSSSLINI